MYSLVQSVSGSATSYLWSALTFGWGGKSKLPCRLLARGSALWEALLLSLARNTYAVIAGANRFIGLCDFARRGEGWSRQRCVQLGLFFQS